MVISRNSNNKIMRPNWQTSTALKSWSQGTKAESISEQLTRKYRKVTGRLLYGDEKIIEAEMSNQDR